MTKRFYRPLQLLLPFLTLGLFALVAFFAMPFKLVAIFFHPIWPVAFGVFLAASVVPLLSWATRKGKASKWFSGPIGVAITFSIGLFSMVFTQQAISDRFGVEVSWQIKPPVEAILLVVNDDFGNNALPRPDSMTILDFSSEGSIELTPVLRDWSISIIEPGQSLAQVHFGINECEPYCELKDLVARVALSEPNFHGVSSQALNASWVISRELGLDSLPVIELNPAYVAGFLEEIGALELTVSDPIPVGGKWVDEEMTEIRYFLEPGNQLLSPEDAVWFARARWGSSNEDRVERQMQLIEAIFEQRSLGRILVAAYGAQDLQTNLISSDFWSFKLNPWTLDPENLNVLDPLG